MASEYIEKKVVAFSLGNPHLGQDEVARHLNKCGLKISGGGIRYVWLRYGIQTMQLRLEKREKRYSRMLWIGLYSSGPL